VSGARPEPVVTPIRTAGVVTGGSPAAGVFREQTWTLGAPTARLATLELTLRNVASLTVDRARAGFRPGEPIALHVNTDGPVSVRIGARTLTLPAGDHHLTV
jgi:hypothetical protein